MSRELTTMASEKFRQMEWPLCLPEDTLIFIGDLVQTVTGEKSLVKYFLCSSPEQSEVKYVSLVGMFRFEGFMHTGQVFTVLSGDERALENIYLYTLPDGRTIDLAPALKETIEGLDKMLPSKDEIHADERTLFCKESFLEYIHNYSNGRSVQCTDTNNVYIYSFRYGFQRLHCGKTDEDREKDFIAELVALEQKHSFSICSSFDVTFVSNNDSKLKYCRYAENKTRIPLIT